MSDTHADFGRRRARLALLLTALTCGTYFGFILLVAFDKPFLARQLTDGLSVGMLLGALVIVVAIFLAWVYVRWHVRHIDNLSPEGR